MTLAKKKDNIQWRTAARRKDDSYKSLCIQSDNEIAVTSIKKQIYTQTQRHYYYYNLMLLYYNNGNIIRVTR